jgi:cell division protease FtsH
MADALMKYETIDVSQIDSIMQGKIPGPPQDWSDDEPGPTPSEPSEKASPDDDPDLDPAKLH